LKIIFLLITEPLDFDNDDTYAVFAQEMTLTRCIYGKTLALAKTGKLKRYA